VWAMKVVQWGPGAELLVKVVVAKPPKAADGF